ncbi:MAG: aldehyde dehydrogenase family protein [Acidimicrobiia bacterium]
MHMFIQGAWQSSDTLIPVVHPYSGETIQEVPVASPEQLEDALASAVRGAQEMRRLSPYERHAILFRAAEMFDNAVDTLAQTISSESGKPIAEARREASRAGTLIRLSAFEAAQARGETIPVDAEPGNDGKIAFTIRQPCGVVVAITPFNYPLLLLLHKVAPALAAGNAVIIKPALQTSMTAIHATRMLIEAGLPEEALQCVTGPGAKVGMPLCADPRVRKITFTGSTAVGREITRVAGVKRLSLELGSNAPLVVLEDADIEEAAISTARAGYVNAGQVCISVQRVIVDDAHYGSYLDAVRDHVGAIVVGDPFEDGTQVSSLISEDAATRVDSAIRDAVDAGASLVVGGDRSGSVIVPAVVADVQPNMSIFADELFGPAVGVSRVSGIDEAIHLANQSSYGLGAGVYTNDITNSLRFAREVDCGSIQINSPPLWRADLMPYGGLKDSGIGKEGPKYAVEEMTETKTVVFH